MTTRRSSASSCTRSAAATTRSCRSSRRKRRWCRPRASSPSVTSDSAILRTERLTVRFGGLTALNDVSVAVPRGEIRAIIGPNGAGKSTFFNCVTGVLRPTAGRIVFEGEDIAGLPPHRISRKAIARSYQITNILPAATVLENVRIAAQSRHHSWNLLRHHGAFGDLIDRARAVLHGLGLLRK